MKENPFFKQDINSIPADELWANRNTEKYSFGIKIPGIYRNIFVGMKEDLGAKSIGEAILKLGFWMRIGIRAMKGGADVEFKFPNGESELVKNEDLRKGMGLDEK